MSEIILMDCKTQITKTKKKQQKKTEQVTANVDKTDNTDNNILHDVVQLCDRLMEEDISLGEIYSSK